MSSMNGLEDVGRFSVEGYSFFTEKDAALAENEKRRVEYLEARLDYAHPDSILKIYNKAIGERIFKSPVGHFFLKNIQNYLLKQPSIAKEDIADIPMYVTFDGEFRDQAKPVAPRVAARTTPKNQQKESKSNALTASVIINLVLAAAVIAMFAITLKSDQPNILNYEKAITNRYAAWDQELTEREKAVRIKERELNIEQ
ncbi:MAG: hypothetical protein IJ794_18460 [Lachnospiraceae bacterium]|nr:hypothetical protein [Lachnospiraceae bacterium]